MGTKICKLAFTPSVTNLQTVSYALLRKEGEEEVWRRGLTLSLQEWAAEINGF